MSLAVAVDQGLLAEYSEVQRDVAKQALLAAFGTAQTESVKHVVGGMTGALTLRVQAGGRAFLLRVEGEPSPFAILTSTNPCASQPKPVSPPKSTTSMSPHE
jgi:hypothetical protein